MACLQPRRTFPTRLLRSKHSPSAAMARSAIRLSPRARSAPPRWAPCRPPMRVRRLESRRITSDRSVHRFREATNRFTIRAQPAHWAATRWCASFERRWIYPFPVGVPDSDVVTILGSAAWGRRCCWPIARKESIMRKSTRWLLSGTLLLGSVAFIGCEKEKTSTETTGSSTTQPSRAEEAGNAAQKAGDEAKKAGAEAKDAAENMKQNATEAANKASENAQEAADKARDAANRAKDSANQLLHGNNPTTQPINK